MKSPLRAMSISLLGLAVAGLIGVSTAGSASAHETKSATVSISATAFGGATADSWSWGGVRPGSK